MENKKVLLDDIYKHIQSESMFLTYKHVYICDKPKTCCFSGNRPEKLPDMGNEKSDKIIEIKKMLFELIEMSAIIGYKYFVSGLARGIDIWTAEMVLELKEKGYDIELHCVIPHLKQASGSWDIEYLKRYYNLLQKCEQSYLVSKQYTNECMYERNSLMVESSALIIGVLNSTKSGTSRTIDCAIANNLIVKIIATSDIAEKFLWTRDVQHIPLQDFTEQDIRKGTSGMDILRVQACSHPINIADDIAKKISNNLPIEIQIIGRNSSHQAITCIALAKDFIKHGIEFKEYENIDVDVDGEITKAMKFVADKI